jgi:bifunctional N-acetylglucosamine-1-phosphate-uridyltransferase/glucosamine-1-phosphate-acetyltransferase GlmU-like protein
VPAEALAVARSRQMVMEGWVTARRAKQAEKK